LSVCFLCQNYRYFVFCARIIGILFVCLFVFVFCMVLRVHTLAVVAFLLHIL